MSRVSIQFWNTSDKHRAMKRRRRAAFCRVAWAYNEHFGAIGKKSIKAIGGMTKAEIEAAAEAERAAAQASWDRVAGMEPAREKPACAIPRRSAPNSPGSNTRRTRRSFRGWRVSIRTSRARYSMRNPQVVFLWKSSATQRDDLYA